MRGEEELVYARGELSVDQIQTEIAKIWQALDNPDSSARGAELSAADFDRTALAGIVGENAIAVRAAASGADPTTALLLVTLAPSANQVIKDLWLTVVLPRIRRRWGDDAIGEEKSMSASASDDPRSSTDDEDVQARDAQGAQAGDHDTPVANDYYDQGRLSVRQALGVLRIEIHGSWSVADLTKLLGRLEDGYKAAAALESLTSRPSASALSRLSADDLLQTVAAFQLGGGLRLGSLRYGSPGFFR